MKVILVNIILSLIFKNTFAFYLNTGCEIDTVKDKSPILIEPGSTSIIYPNNGQKTTLSKGAVVEIACPGGKILVNNIETDTLPTATCIENETFMINNKNVNWDEIFCTIDGTPQVIEIATNDDNNINCKKSNLKILQIGFRLTSDRFVPQIDICFDTTIKLAHYSFYNLVPYLKYQATDVTRPSFKQDSIYYPQGVSLKKLYNNTQLTVNSLLNLDRESTKFVNKSEFPNKGHLAPKGDFFYGRQQKATFRYINVAPQWNTINGGNWNVIENSLRQYAIKNNVLVKVWTGTYGVSNLPIENQNQYTDLYLYLDQNSAIPFPEVYWKLAYDPLNRKGVIIVSHNNPYEDMSDSSKKICDSNVLESISWLKLKHKDEVVRGFVYACPVDDAKFLSFVPQAPVLRNAGLLN